MLSPLEKSILRTIAYFDMFDYPLTATEVWTYLYKPECRESERSLSEVIRVLSESPALDRFIERTEGFYHLTGRALLVADRKWKNLRVDTQMRRTVRLVKLFRLLPWVRMIAIASSISFGNVKPTSDIDLFIVAQKEYIWLTRLWTVGLLKLLGMRPTSHTSRNRFCLTFFVTDDALNVERASFGPDDIVYQYYVASFMPIYDPFKLYERFLRENQWLEQYLPNACGEKRLVNEVAAAGWVRAWHIFFRAVTWPLFNGLLSEWYCRLQLRILPPSLKSIANIDSRVIISDTMLKFHDKDNRRELRERWGVLVARYA